MNEEIKNIYEKILELNFKINSLLNDFPPKENFDNFNENLQEFLDQKDIFIQKLISLKDSNEKEFKKIDLKEISEQVNNIEQENLKLIQEKKVYLSEELNKSNTAAKALSAYKFNKQNEPRIFDETD